MSDFNRDIATMAMKNTDFRRVVLTQKHSQLVLMSVEPGDEIGEETHKVDQILVFVDGEGQAVLDGKKSKVKPNSLVEVPAGTLHNFINTGDTPLKLYTIYAPPEEEPDTVHKTKAEADAAEEEEKAKKKKK
jgi:mannose-6-phosphate isomerase-like protein (cupin superfamily)